jgi:hypothetical protein
MPEASASDIGVSLIKTRLEQKSYDATPSLKPATGNQNSRFDNVPHALAVEGGGTVLPLAHSINK